MTALNRRASHFEPVFTLTAGPTGATPDTLAALGRPVLYHYDPVFLELYADTVELMRSAFGTRQAPVILHGEAVLGLEAAAASLIRRDDVVLNLVSGVYGKGYGWWARRYAKEVLEVEVRYDGAVPADSVRKALEQRPDVSVVSVVHCETPSGTMNDLDAIGPVVAEHGALLIVDAVSSFGGMACDFAAWDADLVVVGPQKCLGGPAGLSLLHVSDAAWEHMEANPDAPRASMLSILDWKYAHLVDRPFPFTPSVSDVYGLRACLEQYLAEGRGAARARQRRPVGPGRRRGARPGALGGGPVDLLGHGHGGQGAAPAGRARGQRAGPGRVRGHAVQQLRRPGRPGAPDRPHGPLRLPAQPGDRTDGAGPGPARLRREGGRRRGRGGGARGAGPARERRP